MNAYPHHFARPSDTGCSWRLFLAAQQDVGSWSTSLDGTLAVRRLRVLLRPECAMKSFWIVARKQRAKRQKSQVAGPQYLSDAGGRSYSRDRSRRLRLDRRKIDPDQMAIALVHHAVDQDERHIIGACGMSK